MENTNNKPKKGQHLRPFNTLSYEEAQAIRAKGREAHKKKAAERRKMKEQLEVLLSLKLHNRSLKKEFAKMGIEDPDNQMAIMFNMIKRAMMDEKDAVAAATFVRDTSGQKPVDTNVTVQTDFESYISKVEDTDEF